MSKPNPVSQLLRWIKGAFWYLVVMSVGMAWTYAPLEGYMWWVGLIVLALVLWPTISKVREIVHF